MPDHTNFVELAKRLIAKQGRQITLKKLAATTADATKPWKGTGPATTSAEATTPAVFLPAQGSGLGKVVTDKELLKRADQVALVAPHETDLEDMTIIVDDSVQWKIEWVQVLKPADQLCLYVFGVCR